MEKCFSRLPSDPRTQLNLCGLLYLWLSLIIYLKRFTGTGRFVLVGVKGESKLTVGLLQLCLGCSLSYAQNLVVILTFSYSLYCIYLILRKYILTYRNTRNETGISRLMYKTHGHLIFMYCIICRYNTSSRQSRHWSWMLADMRAFFFLMMRSTWSVINDHCVVSKKWWRELISV